MTELVFLPSYNEPLKQVLRESIAGWHAEVTSLLPKLPVHITINFDNEYVTPGFGTGGASWDARTLKLALDPKFDASQEGLLAELKAIYFHESYHLARGFSFMTTPDDLPAIKMAIEEGAATKFEVMHADSLPGYATYEARGTMLRWLEEVKGLPDGFEYDWQRWKFFDPATGRRWILYKVGMFIVDEALKHKPELTIEDMSDLTSDEILQLSRL